METALKNRTSETMAIDWLAYKKAETEANTLRVLVENEIVTELAFTKEEGSETKKLNGFKVELNGVVKRKVDWDLFDSIVRQIRQEDADFPIPAKVERKLDEQGVRWLKLHQPGQYARLAKAITAEPGKTGVKVTRTE